MFQVHFKFPTRLVTLICLGLILAFSLSLQGAAAQTPDDHIVYLPLLVKSGALAPADPYTQMLNQVQQLCPAVGLNQVCYANGQVTLQAKSGEIPFSKPGAIADLANVKSLSLASNGADSQQWGLALLRLQANSSTPGQELTLMAFGNVQINDIVLFTGPANQGDELTLPSLQFASSPVAGVSNLGSSGLIVTNATEEDLLSLTLNGAVVTLGSTALVEAKPGDKMTVTMGAGVSLTETNGESSAAVQNHQVSVPLGQNGKVSGPPVKARVIDPLNYFLGGKLFFHLTEERQQKLAEAILLSLNRAIDRCIKGQPAYVYNVLFWTRVIETTPDLKERLDPAKLAQAYNRAPNCLSFEVDFDSTVTTLTTGLTESSHLNATNLSMIFKPNGDLLVGLGAPLAYPKFSYILAGAKCPITTQTTPGQLAAIGGSLKIAGNKVRIVTTIRVSKQPKDKAFLNCPPPLGSQIVSNGHWVTVFYHLHEDLLQDDLASFHFNGWKQTGGEHFGEAIYERTLTEGGFAFNSTTYLILVHTPDK